MSTDDVKFEGLALLTELLDAGWKNMGIHRPDGRNIVIWHRGDDWWMTIEWDDAHS